MWAGWEGGCVAVTRLWWCHRGGSGVVVRRGAGGGGETRRAGARTARENAMARQRGKKMTNKRGSRRWVARHGGVRKTKKKKRIDPAARKDNRKTWGGTVLPSPVAAVLLPPRRLEVGGVMET